MDDRCSVCGAPTRDGRCAPCMLASGFDRSIPDAALIEAYFPQFEVYAPIGRGGMGIVYDAKQVGLDRRVALKVLAPDMAEETGFADRFDREARALGRLDHPNIVRVYEYGENEGLYYLAMEHVEGETLRDLIDRGPVDPARALQLIPQLCAALQYAHDMGVVHRDLKPSNLLIDAKGQVKLVDFGLAQLQSGPPEALTRSTHRLGTPLYMAPEQLARPQDVDHRADIYSLGVLLYEMLVGVPPVGRFQPPSKQASVNRRVDHVVMRALETQPSDRYPSADAMATAIHATRRVHLPRVTMLTGVLILLVLGGVGVHKTWAALTGTDPAIAAAEAYLAEMGDEASDAVGLNNAAWGLVTGDGPYQPALALVLSERSLGMIDNEGPKAPVFLDTKAEALRQLGRTDEALSVQRRAVELAGELRPDVLFELRQRLAKLEGRDVHLEQDPADLNQEAWGLVTDPDVKKRNPARALELSQRSLELLDRGTHSGESAAAAYLDTLAVALDQLGRTEEAIQNQKRAIALAEEHEPGLVKVLTERLAIMDPDGANLEPNRLNELAWGLVTEEPFQPDRALKLSTKSLAGELPEEKRAAYLDTKAEALRQLGEFAEARGAQAEAVEIATRLDLSFLDELVERYEKLPVEF